MKKIILVFFCFFAFMISCDAKCKYSDQRMLNILASYVDYTYDYNYETKRFSLTVYNINDYLLVSNRDDKGVMPVENEQVSIKDLEEGKTITLNVIARKIDDCIGSDLRIITIKLPYYNTFYGNEKCNKNMNKKVCYSKFFDYKVTQKIFDAAINPISFSNEEIIKVNKQAFQSKLLDFFEEYWIGLTISIFSTIIYVLIGNIIYRKIKHGL